LVAEAAGFARERAAAGEIRRTRLVAHAADDVDSALAACRAMRASLQPSASGPIAPRAAIDAIEAGLQHGFDAGSARERELFAECVTSTASKALRHLFFAERE